MRYKGETFEASHPPLLSKKLFDRVQEVLEQKAKPMKRGKIKYHFIGLIRCGECGASVTAETQKKHVYYRCTKKIKPCSQKFLREEALLQQVRAAIAEVHIGDETKEKILDRWQSRFAEDNNASLSRSRQITDDLKECDAKMERLLDLFIERTITPEEYQKKKAKLLDEKQELKETLGEIEKGTARWLELLIKRSKAFV